MITYISTYWQPLVILFTGSLVLILAGYLNWYKDIKADTVRWIAKNIFRDSFRSESSATNMFMVGSSILVAFGLVWIGIAVLYLTA
jgi:hypothetical protein